jgi:hypothetical protein
VRWRFSCVAGVALVWSIAASGAIRFENFASTPGLSFAGDAGVFETRLRLTRAKGDRSGAVWYSQKQPVASGFETTFEFQLTGQGGLGHGADGFAFVVQNSGPDAVGGRGSAGGFAVEDPNYGKRETAIPWSIAVFFDTYRNRDGGDPSNNYVSFCTHGRPSDSRWPAPRLAFTRNLPVQLKDRRTHTARILFRPPVLSIFLDGSSSPVLDATVDFSVVVDTAGSAWVGFTASTGGGYENHDILNWLFTTATVSSNISVVSSEITFAMSACLPDRNLCTPERAFVAPGAGGYHVVLPANMEWGASIPNSSGRAVVLTNAHGIACWDFENRRLAGCSGPSGDSASAGSGFLSLNEPAGALIMRTHDGYTWFSVNGRSGGFAHNEGFYEFDAEIR